MHYGFTATALEQQFSGVSLITNVSLMAAGEPYSPGPANPDSGATGISFCRSDVKGKGKMTFSTAHHGGANKQLVPYSLPQ